MIRTSLLVALGCLGACSSFSNPGQRAVDLAPFQRQRVDAWSEITPPTTSEASAPAPKLLGDKGYTRFKLGSFEPDGDIKGLDTGYYGEVAFGKNLMPFLAVDLSVGYFQADGAGNAELSGVPVLVNGRVQLPILIFAVYGGLGVGGLYADYQVGSFSDDEFLLAGAAFLGAEAGLGNLAVGLEYRYLASEESDNGFTIEGHCGLLTLTLPF